MAKKIKKRKAKSLKRKVKKVVGEFQQPTKKRSYKRRKVKGKTEIRRYEKGHVKAGLFKNISLIIYNKRRKDDIDNLDQFANDIQNDKSFYKKLDTIFYRNRIRRGRKTISVPPFTAVVIVEQRNRDNPKEYHYEPYFMQPPATKTNIRNHTINVVRNHGEFIRQRLTKMGFTSVKYDFSNFKPWYVPSIRIELLYE